MQRYLLDSNVFIQAHRIHYPFDVFPGFWKKLAELAKGGIILSIDKVKEELFVNSDELAKWCSGKLPEEFFKESSACVEIYGEIINWASSSNHDYTSRALEELSDTGLADPWLVAFAKKEDCILVTQESSQPRIKRRVKIPEICRDFKVKYISTVDLFRALGESF